jgi:cell wall-associated NlpC family hydrolase
LTKPLISLALAATLAVAGTTPVLYASSPQVPSSSPAPLVGARIVNVALSYVGYRYAYVGDTPATGFSCTGFVHWVYSQFGYDTPEDLGVLYYSYPHIAPASMQPGDVLLFANTFHAGLSHVAIYIGGGQMVGADNFSVGVHVDAVYDGYFGPRFVGAIRIAPDAAPTQHVTGSAYRRPATTFHQSSPHRPERRPFWHSLRHY